MKNNLYYNPCNLHLSGREYTVIKICEDEKKLIKFPSFGGQTVIANSDDLDNTYKTTCEKKWEEERQRIAKVHGEY